MGYESVLRIPEQNPFFNREGTFYSLLESKVTSIDVQLRPTSISTISLFLTQYRLFAWTQRRPSKRMVSLSFTSTWMLTQLPRPRYCTVRLKSSDNWDASIEYVIEQSAKGYKVRPIYPMETKEAAVEMVDLGRTYRVPFQRSTADGNYEILSQRRLRAGFHHLRNISQVRRLTSLQRSTLLITHVLVMWFVSLLIAAHSLSLSM